MPYALWSQLSLSSFLYPTVYSWLPIASYLVAMHILAETEILSSCSHNYILINLLYLLHIQDNACLLCLPTHTFSYVPCTYVSTWSPIIQCKHSPMYTYCPWLSTTHSVSCLSYQFPLPAHLFELLSAVCRIHYHVHLDLAASVVLQSQ